MSIQKETPLGSLFGLFAFENLLEFASTGKS